MVEDYFHRQSRAKALVQEFLARSPEPWTPFLDRLPLVPKCYHASNGAGPEGKPAGGGADNAATGRFCS